MKKSVKILIYVSYVRVCVRACACEFGKSPKLQTCMHRSHNTTFFSERYNSSESGGNSAHLSGAFHSYEPVMW